MFLQCVGFPRLCSRYAVRVGQKVADEDGSPSPRPTDPGVLFSLRGRSFTWEGMTLKVAESAVLGKAPIVGKTMGPPTRPRSAKRSFAPGAVGGQDGARAHPGVWERSLLAWNWGVTTAFWSFLFILSAGETCIFMFKKMLFLLSLTPYLFVCLFSEVWLLIWPLVLPLGKCPPSPGRQHTTYSNEPQGALRGPRVSASATGDSGTVLEFLCWIL